jgi:hypothetical protein
VTARSVARVASLGAGEQAVEGRRDDPQSGRRQLAYAFMIMSVATARCFSIARAPGHRRRSATTVRVSSRRHSIRYRHSVAAT